MAVNNLNHSHAGNNPNLEHLYESCLQNLEKASALAQVAYFCADHFFNLTPHAFYYYFSALGDFIEVAKDDFIQFEKTSSHKRGEGDANNEA